MTLIQDLNAINDGIISGFELEIIEQTVNLYVNIQEKVAVANKEKQHGVNVPFEYE